MFTFIYFLDNESITKNATDVGSTALTTSVKAGPDGDKQSTSNDGI